MNPLFWTIILLVTSIALYGAAIVRRRRGAQLWTLANDNPLTVGEHAGAKLSGYMDSLYTIGSLAGWINGNRFLLVKQGSADNKYAPITSTIDQPIGVITDDPAATTDPINVTALLGQAKTQRMVAAGVIAAGKPVVSNGDGTVAQVSASTPGVYWCPGWSLTSTTAAGDLVEVMPTLTQFGVNTLT